MKIKNFILVGTIATILLLFTFYIAISFACLELDFRQWSFDGRMIFVVVGGLISLAGGFAAVIFYDIYNNELRK